MFEQSFLDTRPTSQPVGLLTSLTGQLMLLGAALLAPLFFPSKLPRLAITIPLTLTSPPSVLVSHTSEGSSAPGPSEARVFEAPPTIRRGFAAALDAPAPLPEPGFAFSVGVPGGTGQATSFDALARISAAPPPQKRAVSRPVQPDSPLAVGGRIQEAKLLHQVIPVYPPLARAARVSGVVRLVGIIARDGKVRDLQVVSGHPLLVAAALAAVRQWIYRPTLLNGKPVEVICPIEVRFKLD
jgi:protein TonB